jgi:predicted adenine nucleotide alpha hydrolase (AANH) superfamily ATPase
VGGGLGGDQFLVRDFKKKEGFKRSMELAKKWALYRQHYCGCIYSQREPD